MPKIKNREILKLVQQKQDLLEKLARTADKYRINSGAEGTYGQRVRPTIIVPNAEVIQNKDSAAVIILDNNPQYADKAGDFCSRVAIVAGIKGHYLIDEENIKKIEPIKDAAGIYVNQRANTQEDLGLVSPVGWHSEKNKDGIPDFGMTKKRKGTGLGEWYKAHSDVTAYADTVQLVARTGGVNIYAGHHGDVPIDENHPRKGTPLMSSGVSNDMYLGVNLIAGNRIDDYDVTKLLAKTEEGEEPYKIPLYSLQPMVKGHSLMKTLNHMNTQQGDDASKAFSQDMMALIKNVGEVISLFIGFFSAGAGAAEMVINILMVPQNIVNLTKSTETMINSVLRDLNSSPMFSDSYLSKRHR